MSTSDNMSRRQFLGKGTILFTGAAATYLLGGCGGEAIVIPAAIDATLQVGRTVAQYVIDFATKVGIEVVASSIGDWLRYQAGQFQSTANEANGDMRQIGFTEYASGVYRYNVVSNTIVFYCFGQSNGLSGCSAFIRNDGHATIEGPSLLGMSLSASDWQSNDIPVGDGLFPLKALQMVGSDFLKTRDQPFSFKTAAGQLDVRYSSRYPTKNEGLVSVVAKKDNGGTLHGEDYLINWNGTV